VPSSEENPLPISVPETEICAITNELLSFQTEHNYKQLLEKSQSHFSLP
jgi:hypothetical protein